MNKSNLLAGLIITVAVALAIFSVRNDAITTDESPHIPAGYSYLTQKDMRLNPEHPPLIKDLAAVPLLFQKLNFDAGRPSWKDNVNDQWSFGPHFLYEIGNNPDSIAFSARLAVMLIFVLLGLMVYKWGRERLGHGSALLALALTVFSPNILAHGRYVTTDVGAALAFLLAIYFFVKFLTGPSKKHLLFAGLAFGLAQLFKFSLFLLIPFFALLLVIFYLTKTEQDWNETVAKERFSRFGARLFKYFRALAVIAVIGYLVVWPVYQFHVWNYPPERQKADTEFILRSFPVRSLANLDVWMADKPLLRPYAQYLLGLMMVSQRAGGGNTTYFMGEVSSTAWPTYFPTVYILKEPLPVLLAGFLLLLLAIIKTIKKGFYFQRSLEIETFSTMGRVSRISQWIQTNFTEFSWLAFIVFYWLSSISGNLNIGLRHVLPTFPFIYLTIAWQTKKWFQTKSWFFGQPFKILVVGILMIWYLAESFLTFPHYLSYFNELAGGPANGYKYVADSNLDWGQDLKRLRDFVEKNGIEKIKVDYFGGGSPRYYLSDRYEQLDANNADQRHGWLAISATLLQGGRAKAVKGYDRDTTYYRWLDNYQPVAKIGYSIFVYKID
ncbi:MAG: glycosyltransferase family 39 protein [Parcubacteria group bacterium]|nr:glycosyltransferase family 39 protein [Parcubacteria group bacterium]